MDINNFSKEHTALDSLIKALTVPS